MKIKAIPIKSDSLCGRCYFNSDEHCFGRQKNNCDGCSINNPNESVCKCLKIDRGEPCRFFKPQENTFPQKPTRGFYVDKCKCGGNIYVQFGFSCTGKPQSTLQCDKCFKAVIIIGNLKQGTKFMDIWEGANKNE